MIYEVLAKSACDAVFMVIFPLKIMANWDDEKKGARVLVKILALWVHIFTFAQKTEHNGYIYTTIKGKKSNFLKD